MIRNLDGLTIDQLRLLVRTVDMHAQGYIWRNPLTGEEVLLSPMDVMVVSSTTVCTCPRLIVEVEWPVAKTIAGFDPRCRVHAKEQRL